MTSISPSPAPASVLRSVCVYCGSSIGKSPVHAEAAQTFGHILGEAGVELVYGGGGTGLMGTIARAVRAAGGRVTGIIPDFLVEREGKNIELDERFIVPDMHIRKRMMFDRADGFVALPGGIGTLEELVEMLTWSQLGRHGKPIVIADIDGFWHPLNELFTHMRDQGFLRTDPDFSPRYSVVGKVEDILPTLRNGVLPGREEIPIQRF